MGQFDKNKLIDNIYFLAKEKNIKIGELEKSVYVSIGYFSRFKKLDKETSLSVDTLCLVAERLGVSLDTLLFSNLKELSSEELYIFGYLNSFINLTLSGNFKWIKVSKNNLNEMYNKGIILPFINYIEKNGNVTISYKSYFDDFKYVLCDIYKLETNYSSLYLVSLINDKNEKIFEFYLYTYDDLKKIYRSDNYSNTTLNELLIKLYNLVLSNNKLNVLDNDTKKELDRIFDNI